MKKKHLAILVIIGSIALLLTTSLVFARPLGEPGGPPIGAQGKYKSQAGKSNITHLYLYEKDPNWEIVHGGAWGKLTYDNGTGYFVFNGHMLETGQEYALINFARAGNEWPATINILGSAVAVGGGQVHITGSYAYGDLEYDTTPSSGSMEGYKIWLVLLSDIVSGKLSGWQPTEYLFEHNLI